MTTPSPPSPESLADRIAENQDADVLLCNSPIGRGMDNLVFDLCLARKRRTSVLLILVTDGGDPDSAYRIARCLQAQYEKFICYIPGCCKSAGTLIALGSHELVMSIQGELGPLDVQMAKKDEILASQSGLTVMSALTVLHEKALLAFEHFFTCLIRKSAGRITLRTSTDIAAKLTAELFAPLYSQIDPMHVGEAVRAMSIGRQYAKRLIDKSGNFRKQHLDFLISSYPSHGFVIDRAEAESLFENIRDPNPDESMLATVLAEIARIPSKAESGIVQYLSQEFGDTVDEEAENNHDPTE